MPYYLSDLPVTTYELGRMKALEAAGLSHEAAKTQIYAERGPSGNPKVSAWGGDAPIPAAPVARPTPVVPAPVVTPNVVVAARELGAFERAARWLVDTPWWKTVLAGGAIGVGAFVASRLTKGSAPEFDAGDAPTGFLSKNPGEMIRGVVYAPGETGWVEAMGDGTFRIANVPLASLNVDDVVTLKTRGGRLTVDKVVSRVFEKKGGVRYQAPHEKNYQKLRRAFEKKGWKLEGGVPGFAQLAHDGSEPPEAVANRAGVEITVESMRLR